MVDSLNCTWGRYIPKGDGVVTLLPSTAFDGAISRIVPELDQGAIVTIPVTLLITWSPSMALPP